MKAVAIYASGIVQMVDWQIAGECMDVYDLPLREEPRRFRPYLAQANFRGEPNAEPSVTVWIEQADPEKR